MKRFLQLASFSGTDHSKVDVRYEIDLLKRRCSCTAFQKEGDCKHLIQLGAYRKDKTWTSSNRPTFSQALSGLVKTIRLRKVEEAVKWMLYLDTLPQEGGRFRVARRILIGSAEDGHSISVMERVARNFAHLCKADTHLIELAAEIVRICKVPSWWDVSTGGHNYIYSGMVANRLAHLYKYGGENHEEACELLEDGIVQKDAIMAMTAFEKLMLFKKQTHTDLVKYICSLGASYANPDAIRLCEVHLMHKGALSGDSNFVGQAVWLLAGGECSVLNEIHTVMATEVKAILVKAWEEMKKFEPMNPAWADGIHCGGVDRRFAGVWADMNAVCMAFNHYGRVDPNDKWLRKFYVLDGLDVEEVGDEELPDDFE